MGLGSLISALLMRKPSERLTCWLLSFAAGIMTGIVCFGLMPEARRLSGLVAAVSGLFLGVVIIMLLNRAVDKFTENRAESLKLHHTHAELYHQSDIIKNRERTLRAGIIMLAAISLHNLPEGIAIGAGGQHDSHLGSLIALMIALHNIPEGMAVAAPLIAGGVSKRKVVLLTTVSGTPTLIGGLVGIAVGGISDFAVAVSLSAAGGAMLYAVFGEIIPQSVFMTENRIAPLITLAGLMTGMLLCQ